MSEKMTLERAEELMNTYHCSQSVIAYGAEKVGFDKELLMKMSCGLGGGCFAGELCGCVSGAVLTLSAVYGFGKAEEADKDALCKEKVALFLEKYRASCGGLRCQELLGGKNMGIPEEKAYIIEHGLWDICPEYVRRACDILDEILDADEE